MPHVLLVGRSWQAFDTDGGVRDEDVASQLRGLGVEVVRAARQMAAHGTCDYADRPAATAAPAGA